MTEKQSVACQVSSPASSGGNVRKLSQLARLLPRHPVEFWDRVNTILEVRRERIHSRPVPHQAAPFEDALRLFRQALGRDLDSILAERALVDIGEKVVSRIESLRNVAPFGLFHNADFTFAKMCYAACRALAPAKVVETGVAYGVTSSFILQALFQGTAGELSSIDLPPLGEASDSFVGFCIPQDWRSRWHLYRGQSKRLLPGLLNKLGSADMFIHDSLHTYRNMIWEFRTVWPYLRYGGILISDDVDQNNAFADFVQEVRPSFSVVVQEKGKEAAFGVLIKQCTKVPNLRV